MEEGYTISAPPRLKWGWVFALSVVTFGAFNHVWLIVQSRWSDKVRGGSTSFMLSILNASFYVIMQTLSLSEKHVLPPGTLRTIVAIAGGFTALVQVILYFCTVFVLRSELQKEPIGIPLGGLMTFLFGTVYFQYFLSDYGGSISGSGSLGLSSTEPVVLHRVEDAPPV